MPRLPTIAGYLRTSARSIWRAGVDFIYERSCPSCHRELPDVDPADRGGPRLCDPCAAELAPPVQYACDRCGAPVGPYLDTSDGCIHCRQESFAFNRAIALGAYDGALRLAALAIKQPDGAPLAAAVADLFWQRSELELRNLVADVVVAVPHHWIVRLARGHNPAETLAAVLASRLGLPFARRWLRKIRHTPSQTSLTYTERRANLRGAFRAQRTRRLAGRRVLLVDDVLTTGTTAHRATRELLKAGAAAVVVAVVARGIGRAGGGGGGAP
ncbi:MAG TPA: phosphoribosyltransferase family protein [Planctomycetaceae bacterium]|nr:phosphoribosyltransferase family protein [Planctomycetaceae bacterium]